MYTATFLKHREDYSLAQMITVGTLARGRGRTPGVAIKQAQDKLSRADSQLLQRVGLHLHQGKPDEPYVDALLTAWGDGPDDAAVAAQQLLRKAASRC
jgi:hypothetical protein